MKQRRYIKPKVKVRELRIALLNDVSVPGSDWGNAKRNSIMECEIQSGVDELDRMFE